MIKPRFSVRFNWLFVMLADAAMISVAWFSAYFLRFNLQWPDSYTAATAYNMLPLILVVQLLAGYWFRLYRSVWRFASLPDLIKIIKATVLGTGTAVLLAFTVHRLQGVPRSVLPLYAIINIMLMGGTRLMFRVFKHMQSPAENAKRVLIIGAGQAGEGLVRDMLHDNFSNYLPIAFLDDNKHRHGKEIHGVRVVGDLARIVSVINIFDIDLIMIATPSATTSEMRNIVAACEQAKIRFVTLPGLSDLAAGKITVNALREVAIEDLLGRDQVQLDWRAIAAGITGQTVLVTGGGGSIGSELCRQIANLKPKNLIIVEHSEYNLYQIERELTSSYPGLNLHKHLVCVTDERAIKVVMNTHRPEIVFHAAAYKHVPMLENQIQVAIKNNVIGTRIVAEAAAANNVKKFILISTDKAVNPANIMGRSKRIAEIFCQSFNQQVQTQFITVRFGNVLGSAGSVVPLFREQLQRGGPLTVTDPDITRYFMTIPEACQLILQSMVLGAGGEIFMLDMGEPIKISYLAEQMIRLAGKEIGRDIDIEFVGLRPGEKLYEELFYANEPIINTKHEKIFKAKASALPWQQIKAVFNTLATHNVIERSKFDYLYGNLTQIATKPTSLEQEQEVVA
jgi:FlaA1/EpsC-like NDP-sugar epimerase